MAKGSKKTGQPRAVQKELEAEEHQTRASEDLSTFVKEMHGDEATALPQDGLPSLDWLKEQFKTKSAIIRYLVNQKFAVNDIAKHLGLRYQHVRNVANAPLKRGPNEDWRKPLLDAQGVPDFKSFKPEPD